MEQEKLKGLPTEKRIFNLDDEDIELDDSQLDDVLDDMIFSMQQYATLVGYPKLMEMSKEFNSKASEEEKTQYLSTIKIEVPEELKEMFPSSDIVLEMVFNFLSTLNQDFLVNVSKLITDNQTRMLFEGMIYMGLATEEDMNEEGISE